MHVCKTLTNTNRQMRSISMQSIDVKIVEHYWRAGHGRTGQHRQWPASAVGSLSVTRPTSDPGVILGWRLLQVVPGARQCSEGRSGTTSHRQGAAGVDGRGWHAILTFHCNSDVSCKLCISIHTRTELYKVSPLPVFLVCWSSDTYEIFTDVELVSYEWSLWVDLDTCWLLMNHIICQSEWREWTC